MQLQNPLVNTPVLNEKVAALSEDVRAFVNAPSIEKANLVVNEALTPVQIGQPILPIIDIIQPPFINLPPIQIPPVQTGGTPGDSLPSEYQPLVSDIRDLNSQIEAKRAELANAAPEDKQIISLELQNLLQERLQLMSTLSNLLKTEHETLMAVISNLR